MEKLQGVYGFLTVLLPWFVKVFWNLDNFRKKIEKKILHDYTQTLHDRFVRIRTSFKFWN